MQQIYCSKLLLLYLRPLTSHLLPNAFSFYSSILPAEWQDISDDNIKKAEQEHIASTTLRGVINSVLEQTQQDLLRQRQTVNSAFYKRIQEVTNAKKTLEEHLNQVEYSHLLQ